MPDEDEVITDDLMEYGFGLCCPVCYEAPCECEDKGEL